jgi:hypothetical protein
VPAIRNIKAFPVAIYLRPASALGVEILPVILLIDVVLAVKRVYEKWAAVVQAIVLVIGWCFCLQGLRQIPSLRPESGIIVGSGANSRFRAVSGESVRIVVPCLCDCRLPRLSGKVQLCIRTSRAG